MQQNINRQRKYGFIFLLCWISYFSTYIGRQNYTAVMAEIIEKEGFLNSACGLVGTGFFISYGAGQVVSGFLGDRLNPKHMIFTGIFLSSLVNLSMAFLTSPKAMAAAWCINGGAQSMTWSPILRVFSEHLPEDKQKSACVNIATTYPAAILLIYPICSLLVYFSGWRTVFLLSGFFMLAVSALWFVGFTWVERWETEKPETQKTLKPLDSWVAEKEELSFTRSLLLLLLLLGTLLAFQGALRDGVTGWVPSYLSNTYQVGTFVAIFATSFLPLVNMFGVYFANFIYRRLKKNELETTMILFSIAFGSMICLVLTEGLHLFVSLVFFSIITSCMMGTNVMLVSFVPTYFIRFGKVSTISGLLNATVYIGSSISTYGLGAIADRLGWPFLIKILCALTLAGVIVCRPAAIMWKRFLKGLP